MDSQPIDQKSLLIGLIKPTYISVKRNLFLSRITAKQMINVHAYGQKPEVVQKSRRRSPLCFAGSVTKRDPYNQLLMNCFRKFFCAYRYTFTSKILMILSCFRHTHITVASSPALAWFVLRYLFAQLYVDSLSSAQLYLPNHH